MSSTSTNFATATCLVGVGFLVGKWSTFTTTPTPTPTPVAKLDLDNPDDAIQVVRAAYTRRAASQGSCCGGGTVDIKSTALKLGYAASDVAEFSQQDGTNLGESCGNPLSFANLQVGETVVDLGSGAGFDCLLAGRIVGSTGKVIGVDMTPAMIDRARRNVSRGSTNGAQDAPNVTFRLGEIEHLPLADSTVDCLVSNCVLNLTQDKQQVYQEIHRVLKPNGRLAIADVISIHELPERLKNAKALAC